MFRLLFVVTLLFGSTSVKGAEGGEDICFAGTQFANCAASYEAIGVTGTDNMALLKKAIYFQGYVDGAFQRMTFQREICAPSGVTYAQVWAITAKWLRDNPDLWHYAPYFLVNGALKKAFPACPALTPEPPKGNKK